MKEKQREKTNFLKWNNILIVAALILTLSAGVFAYEMVKNNLYPSPQIFGHSAGEINFTGIEVRSGDVTLTNGKICLGNGCITKEMAQGLISCGSGYSPQIIEGFTTNIDEDIYGSENYVSSCDNRACVNTRILGIWTTNSLDTCDGDFISQYSCREGEQRTCTDVYTPTPEACTYPKCSQCSNVLVGDEGSPNPCRCSGSCNKRTVTCKQGSTMSIVCANNAALTYIN